MRVINHTKLPDTTVKEIVRWLTKGITRRISTITISYTRKHAYRGDIRFGFTMPIKVAFAKQESGLYPISMNAQRHVQFNFPIYDVNTEEEAFLVILAHEIHHAKGRIHHRRSTEKMAESFAFKKLQEFRRKREEK